MDTNDNPSQPDEQHSVRVNDKNDRREGTEETGHVGASDRDVSGNSMADENREDRKHHQQFGNRK